MLELLFVDSAGLLQGGVERKPRIIRTPVFRFCHESSQVGRSMPLLCYPGLWGRNRPADRLFERSSTIRSI